ncbi:MAG: thermonuclease family protein [Candidatus Nanoarchaeia archaeon]
MKKIVIVVLVIVTGIIYYFWAAPSMQAVRVDEVIDGDTLIVEGDIRVRLKSVNAPEKGMLGYEDAKDFLDRFEGKQVWLDNQGADRYGRILGYIYYDNILINQALLEKGLAHLYYYDRPISGMEVAEEQARQAGRGIWQPSRYAGCVELVNLKIDEPEHLILENHCNTSLQVVIKDDATHIYEEQLDKGRFTKNFSHIWNNEGDSLYVWDDGLIVFYRY